MKNRWLLFEVLTCNEAEENSFGKKEVALKMKQLLYTTFGTFANLEVNLWLHELKEEKGIIEVNRQGLPLLRVILTFLHKIKGTKVLINDLLVSGTIKKLKRKAETVESWKERLEKVKQKFTSIEGIKEKPSIKFSPFENMEEEILGGDGSAGI